MRTDQPLLWTLALVTALGSAIWTVPVTAQVTMEERMLGVVPGARVQSPAGEAIGTVTDVVPDTETGRPGYVVIATTSGLRTAVPYSAIWPSMHDGRVVLDRGRLESAPPLHEQELRDTSNTQWQKQADQYWN